MFAPSADGQQHVGTRGEAAVAGSPSVDLQRRMRHNEYAAVLACLTYVDAQNKYAARDWTGSGVNIYAQRIVSTPGRKDGLYWPAADGDESPLDKFMAAAASETPRGKLAPYHGYVYKILTKQGRNAPGGALDYMWREKMVHGFALVAYPAVYRNTGVMTFLVSHAGTVYHKDLGSHTARIAARMDTFDPDSTWTKAPMASAFNTR